MYQNILTDIKNIVDIHLIIKTIGIIDYYKGYHNYSEKQIKQVISTRGGDVSKGSTYIIDLKNNKSYRFRDHKRYMSHGDFRGFFYYKNGNKFPENATFNQLNKNKGYLIISEVIKGEVHDSTPIEKISFVPSSVSIKCIKTRDIEKPLELWNSFF